MGVFFICSASDTIFAIFFLLKPPADGRWSANYSLRNTAVDVNFRESAPVLHQKQWPEDTDPQLTFGKMEVLINMSISLKRNSKYTIYKFLIWAKKTFPEKLLHLMARLLLRSYWTTPSMIQCREDTLSITLSRRHWKQE